MRPNSKTPRSESTSHHAPTRKREIVVPHDAEIRPVTAMRSGLIQSSFTQLREHGYFERYAAHIDAGTLQELMSTLGPSWVPIELVDAHYRACDAMRLDKEEMDRMGQATGKRVRETSL